MVSVGVLRELAEGLVLAGTQGMKTKSQDNCLLLTETAAKNLSFKRKPKV